jgi:hypothetical protein
MSEFKKFPPVSERWLPPISRRRAGGQAGADFKLDAAIKLIRLKPAAVSG